MAREILKENLSRLEDNVEKLANKAKVKFTQRLRAEDSLLLLVDIQEKLIPVIYDKEKLIINISKLIAIANELDIPIIVTEQYPEGLGSSLDFIKNNISNKDLIMEKIHFSAYGDKKIRESIEKYKKPNIIVAGVESHICVYQTVRDLQAKGYTCYIAKEGVSSRTEENKINGLDLMKDQGAKISNIETILFDLLVKAGTEEFRKLSKLIK